MSQPALEAPKLGPNGQLEVEIEEAIALCAGDVRAALRATLIANAYLQDEVDRLSGAVSTGFARGRIRRQSSAPKGEMKKAR